MLLLPGPLPRQFSLQPLLPPTPKVFDVRLNGHVVVKDLDIFDRVGHSTAHDEIIAISIKKGKLSVQGEVSTFTGKLNIEFVKVRTGPACSEFSPPVIQALRLC